MPRQARLDARPSRLRLTTRPPRLSSRCRVGGGQAPGSLHHVIIRGIEKRRIVDDDKDRQGLVSRIATIATETNTLIYAWALMTNHAHILLRSGPCGLSRYMKRLLPGYAIYYNHRHRRHGHLFQNRYPS